MELNTGQGFGALNLNGPKLRKKSTTFIKNISNCSVNFSDMLSSETSNEEDLLLPGSKMRHTLPSKHIYQGNFAHI